MTIAELKGSSSSLAGAINVRERTPDQMVFDVIMSGLDRVKMFYPDLERRGDVELVTKTVKMNTLEGLSDVTIGYLGGSKRVDLFVEYEASLTRRVGIRNGSREVVFELDKIGELCTAKKGERIGTLMNKKWETVDAEDIPTSDALILVQKGFV